MTYTHTLAPIEDEIRYLNYDAVLTGAVVGAELGPDMQGRMWRIADIVPRIDGKPGTRAKLWWRPRGITIENDATRE